MLWSTLFDRIGKLPLRITQHQQVKVIINGVDHELELKFTPSGDPFLVPKEEAPKPSKH